MMYQTLQAEFQTYIVVDASPDIRDDTNGKTNRHSLDGKGLNKTKRVMYIATGLFVFAGPNYHYYKSFWYFTKLIEWHKL